ncbi:extensin [Vitis vinifera]|uniref:extensin n=1 Tax=Vitis vinifera TaxID=29760 RepID=UPI00053F71EE|nr:extensin [Vitis vinifera]|eukprot:XP_010653285.1 PREDICTED: extensin-like [Vitis vinifera]
MGAAPSPPVQAPAIPPSEGEAPSQRRYPTRRPPTDPVPPADRAQRPAPRPPAKRTKFSGPGESSHAPQAEPPTEEPRIPVEITPETIIRRPMIAGPPIEAHTSVHMPEAIHPSSPLTQAAPPVVPATPAPPPSSEPTVTVSLAEFRGLIQQHLSMQTPLEHDRSAPSEPLVPDEESLPAEQPIPEEEIRAEPSHDLTHI